MSQHSIMVALDGSLYSRYAADLCWRIAQVTGSSVTALHVVDTHGAKQLCGPDSVAAGEAEGFLRPEEARFFYKNVCEQLHSQAKFLASHYLADALRHGVTTNFVIAEGDPVSVIVEQAARHDLVVIGHSPNKNEKAAINRQKLIRLSLAEALSHECPRPLLFVQAEVSMLSEITVLLSIEHLNELYIDRCLNLAAALDLPVTFLCLTADLAHTDTAEFVHNLKEANPKLKNLLVEVTTLAAVSRAGGHAFSEEFILRKGSQQSYTVLPVLPTRKLGKERLTVLGGSTSNLVRTLVQPAMLLMPEECSQPAVLDDLGQAVC
ncbi:MAG: universal stress protein [Cyanobacteria bacterium REEB67]|nr:universal stress protein [Cyanobacteria bacterium REEB67]